MKPTRAEIKQAFKSAALSGDQKFAARIANLARSANANLVDSNEIANLVPLKEFLAIDYRFLRKYLGETQFTEMAKSYCEANSSTQPNARWFSTHLAEFLRGYAPFSHHPEIQELAALELALNSAFTAPEAAALTLADLTTLDPEIFSSMNLGMHPSASRLTFTQNTTSIWSALKCETQPPKPHLLDEQQQTLVWRQGAASRFRLLGNEEAMAFDAAKTGASFSTICQLIAFMDSPETTAARAASYLRGWIEAELLLAAPTFAVRPEK